MTFNQQLIEKARKGEIAILNDGSVEELRAVTGEIARRIGSTDHKYIILTPGGHWECSTHLQKNIIARPVRDFFLEEIEIPGSISMNADDLIGNLEPKQDPAPMTAIKQWIDKQSEVEAIYEPKYGGKDHSGYDTMMKYEVNYERMDAFSNGLTKGIEISVGFSKWAAWNYLLNDGPDDVWFDKKDGTPFTTSQLLEKYLDYLKTLEP